MGNAEIREKVAAKFYFTNKAVEYLGAIWRYTLETWSENQAKIYYDLIIEACREITNTPEQGKTYEVVEKSVLGFKTGQHVIFYGIVAEKEIEILRILHGIMDITSVQNKI